MTRARELIAAAALAVAVSAAGALAQTAGGPTPRALSSPALPVPPVAPGAAAAPPEFVLARYRQALGAVPHPKAFSFEYSVEQLGLRNLVQTHRIYRSGLRERDETLMVDGYTLKRPAIRILANRTNRYDVAAVAPRADDYAFRYAGFERGAPGPRYRFATTPLAPRPFTVSEVEIDARTFLPSAVRFRVHAATARGKGELRFAAARSYWLIRQARVDVRLPSGESAHERIAWTKYEFPTSLPPSTFQAPRSVAPALPSLPPVTPTPAAPAAVAPLAP